MLYIWTYSQRLKFFRSGLLIYNLYLEVSSWLFLPKKSFVMSTTMLCEYYPSLTNLYNYLILSYRWKIEMLLFGSMWCRFSICIPYFRSFAFWSVRDVLEYIYKPMLLELFKNVLTPVILQKCIAFGGSARPSRPQWCFKESAQHRYKLWCFFDWQERVAQLESTIHLQSYSLGLSQHVTIS